MTSVVYESYWTLIEKPVCLSLHVGNFVFTPMICLSSVPYLGARVLQALPAICSRFFFPAALQSKRPSRSLLPMKDFWFPFYFHCHGHQLLSQLTVLVVAPDLGSDFLPLVLCLCSAWAWFSSPDFLLVLSSCRFLIVPVILLPPIHRV
jgi:hypothetical protein